MKIAGLEELAEEIEMSVGDLKIACFTAAVKRFNLTDETLVTITDFARMCGFLIAADIQIAE